ncbi:acyl-CoA dehydrogenase family protein [Streptomyces lycii]|uniref:acyl-CoA dehydrogenase n=1 Tax=Streptomyces lycii TaxID=2654337 RepID=UPI0038B53A10
MLRTSPDRQPVRRGSRPATGVPRPAPDPLWPRVTRELADDLAADAVARDRAAGPPYDEVARLREAGLPALLTAPGPARHGTDWRTACAVIREISAADSSIGELVARHYVLSWSGRFFGSADEAATGTAGNGTAGNGTGGGADDDASGNSNGNSSGKGSRNSSNSGNGNSGGSNSGNGNSGSGRANQRHDPFRSWLLGGDTGVGEPDAAVAGATLTPAPGGYVLRGRRNFAAGVGVADRFVVGAPSTESGEILIVLVDPGRPGVLTVPVRDRLGQRLAAAGTVDFDDVRVERAQVIGAAARDEHAVSPAAALAPLALRLALAHVSLGIAQEALAEARDISRAAPSAAERGAAAPAARSGTDPYLLSAYGELAIDAHTAAAVVDRATDAMARGLSAGRNVSMETCADISVLVAAAEAVTGRATAHITARVLELTDRSGPPGITDRAGSGAALDRFWRNARVLTAQSSPAHRLRDIGDHYLNGSHPPFAHRP